MHTVRLDPDLEQLLERDVDDLARFNILRYLHDNPDVRGSVGYFANQLGLRSLEHAEDALEALARRGLLSRTQPNGDIECRYGLSPDPVGRNLVDRLYYLGSSSQYGEIVERLAARSLHRARRALAASRSSRRTAQKSAVT